MSFDLRPRKRAGALHSPLAVREEVPFARKGLCFLQHDYDVGNGSGATVRADINNALEALATLSSGATEPGTTYPYQLWADTTSGLLKQRNAANGAWEVRGTLAETMNVSRSSNTILAAGDHMKFFVATSSFTQTLTAAATLGDGWFCYYRVNAGATITFDPNSTEQIDGATTKVVVGPGSGIIFCDGSAFQTYGFDPGVMPLSAIAATTSGSTKDFTVNALARQFIVTLAEVSSNGTSGIGLQLGDSGGIETTGYADATSNNAQSSSLFPLTGGGSAAAATYSGSVTLTLADEATNTWVISGVVARTDGTPAAFSVAGCKSLTGMLTTIRLMTANGTDTFDAGGWNVRQER